MKRTTAIWVVLLMVAAWCCWLPLPSAQTPRIRDVDKADNSQHIYLLGSTTSTIPSTATITGILTDPQFRVVIRALEQRGGNDLLAAPKVTTLPSRSINRVFFDKTLFITNR